MVQNNVNFTTIGISKRARYGLLSLSIIKKEP